MQEAVDAANATLSRPEQIKRFTFLDDDWLPGGDELTPTMKLKRRPIRDKYADEIEAMYAAAALRSRPVSLTAGRAIPPRPAGESNIRGRTGVERSSRPPKEVGVSPSRLDQRWLQSAQ